MLKNILRKLNKTLKQLFSGVFFIKLSPRGENITYRVKMVPRAEVPHI
jgi:hypothetical protein